MTDDSPMKFCKLLNLCSRHHSSLLRRRESLAMLACGRVEATHRDDDAVCYELPLIPMIPGNQIAIVACG